MLDEALLSINQVTLREQWSLAQAIEGYARHGVHGIAVWRDKLEELGVEQGAKMLRQHDMTVTGFCIGGLLTPPDPTAFRARIDDNRRAIEMAAAIDARCIVFVAGGLEDGDKDINSARARCLEGLEILLPEARAAGVTLALEPLHPMVCATRSVLTTLAEANDWCDQLGDGPELGIAVDVYHLWWDPNLATEIARAGRRIVAFHVNDWLADTCDLRLDRGMMGDGVIDIPAIRAMVEATGYEGHREVEIFSARNWWRRDPDEVVAVIKERYQSAV
ncbi:MAG: sugar phosphate isomerase/epimerase family protein [Alphaproteobacteria bacterium]|nr:sugar phosphate isomerase/epimerase family protein [Alphaproteobacteria bacterium]